MFCLKNPRLFPFHVYWHTVNQLSVTVLYFPYLIFGLALLHAAALEAEAMEVEAAPAADEANDADVQPSIAISRANLQLAEVKAAMEAGRLKADGKILKDDGVVAVVK